MSARRAIAVRAVAAAMAILTSAAAAAENPFPSLTGSWSGSGHVRLANGQTEALKCKAYYTSKSGGSGLGLAIRCASASNKIDMRASLEYSGGSVSGSWEERSFNAAGNVTGKASGNRLSLSINGGGLTGSMSVTTSGTSQSVNISTEGVGFKGVSIDLSRV